MGLDSDALDIRQRASSRRRRSFLIRLAPRPPAAALAEAASSRPRPRATQNRLNGRQLRLDDTWRFAGARICMGPNGGGAAKAAQITIASHNRGLVRGASPPSPSGECALDTRHRDRRSSSRPPGGRVELGRVGSSRKSRVAFSRPESKARLVALQSPNRG